MHELELIRWSDDEKLDQISHMRTFQALHEAECPVVLAKLQKVVRERGSLFAELIGTVKSSLLSQLSAALFDVGGEYRRNL